MYQRIDISTFTISETYKKYIIIISKILEDEISLFKVTKKIIIDSVFYRTNIQ